MKLGVSSRGLVYPNINIRWKVFHHRPTEDQIREEAYFIAEADEFKLSSKFYWNLAKEQLEDKIRSDFGLPSGPIAARLERDTFAKFRALVARASSKEIIKVKYTKIPYEFNFL